MYREAKPLNSFFVGCEYQCKYCVPTFQRQMKRQKHRCSLCYYYSPHSHLKRFKIRPPKTKYGEFIFLCDFGDVSFASRIFMLTLIGYCHNYIDRNFLVQSKNPACFRKYNFPENVILGTTIETNSDELIREISKAPSPQKRLTDLVKLKHPKKSITIEPILAFDLDTLVSWIEQIRDSCEKLIVYVGYDSHPNINKLNEPSEEKTRQLIKELRKRGIEVREKLIRKAWWE